jgi:hypothetical protein
MSSLNLKYTGPKVVLTEGKNDCHVILALCLAHDVPESFGFYDCGSDDLVLKRLSALLAGSEKLQTICVVLDADNPNLGAKWVSIKDRLAKEGYSVPERPNPDGTFLEAYDKPKIGVWLMPDNNIDGMLEDFCHQLAGDDAIGFAKSCVRTAKEKTFTSFIDNHESKAIIHTYLAWQNEPGMPLGQAITAKALDAGKPLAQKFAQFLNSLFSK